MSLVSARRCKNRRRRCLQVDSPAAAIEELAVVWVGAQIRVLGVDDLRAVRDSLRLRRQDLASGYWGVGIAVRELERPLSHADDDQAASALRHTVIGGVENVRA